MSAPWSSTPCTAGIWASFSDTSGTLGVDSPKRESLVANSVQSMRSLLPQFYRMWHEQDRMSELSDLSERNLGANAGIRTIRTKAAETRPLLPYTSFLIKQNPNRLPVADGLALAWRVSRQCSMLAHKAVRPSQAAPQSHEAPRNPVRTEASCVRTHWGVRPLHGNPRDYAVFQDNGKMKNFAATLASACRVPHCLRGRTQSRRVTAKTEAIAHTLKTNTDTCSSVQSYTRPCTCRHTRTRTTNPPQKQQQQ